MIWKTLQRNLCSVAAAALATIGVAPSPAQSTVVPNRITAAVNNGDRVTMANSVRPTLAHAADLGPASTSLVARHMALVLTRTGSQQAALDQYLRDVQNPQSASFRQWLTPEQFGERFGASQSDVQTLAGWLSSQGLTVERIASARNVIFFSGNVGQVQTAFGTQVHAVTVNGERHIANVTEAQLPRALAAAVKGVVGLDDFRTRSHAIRSSSARWSESTHSIQPDLTLFDSAGDSYLYLDPADASVVYDTPNSALNPNYKGASYDGTGITVGIVGDSNYLAAPVSNYRMAFLGETSSTLNMPTTIIDGSDPGVNGDSVETYLDLEVLGGIAPKAKLNYYTSAGTDLSDPLFDSIERAVNDNQVSILSISYGGCEAGLGTANNAFINETYQQAAAQGITVVVSTGDSGSAGCDSASATMATQGLAVSGLSTTPFNVAVGGTDFPALLSSFNTYASSTTSGTPPYYLTAKSYIPERPWNDSTSVNGLLASNVPLQQSTGTNIIGGTGGKSSLYTKPDFQTALTPADSARDVPDVSFLAGNGLYGAVWVICENHSLTATNDCATTGGNFTSATTFAGAGGTSAATPAFAGMLALVEQAQGTRLGVVNETLYRLAASKYSTVFHDVTAGNISVVCSSGSTDCGSNGFLTGYNAGTGYDYASGLGSVDAAALLANWTSGSGTLSTTGLTINGSTAAVSTVHGSSLNFGVTVKPGTATGTAGIVNTATQTAGSPTLNGSPFANMKIAGGTGTLSYNGLPGGTYNVYANYTGDASNYGSQSNSIPVTITAEDGSTRLTVSAYNANGAALTSLTGIPYGSYIFGHASVYGTNEGFDASLGYGVGSFTFLDNGKTIGTAVNNTDNFASFPAVTGSTYPYAVGAHTLTATWPGDASYKANTSNGVSFTVVQASTTISASAQVATISSLISDAVTVNVMTNGTGGAPTGTITLTANGKTLVTTTAINGAQSVSTGATFGTASVNLQGSTLAPGANTITATYSGDNNYGGSSGTFVINVTPASYSIAAGAINTNAGATTGNSSTITVTPSGSFAGLVNLSCAVTSAPANVTSPITCSVPASVNVTGTIATTGTLTVNSSNTTTVGAYTVTISGVDAATGNVKASGTALVNVTASPIFTLANSGAVTVTAGATSGNTSTLTVTPANGFTGAVAVTCAVTTAPANASKPITCGLSSSSITIAGTTAGTTTLSITSTATTTAAMNELLTRGVGGTALAFTVLCVLPLRRRRFGRLLLTVAMIGGFGAMVGCGNSSSSNNGGGTKTTVPGTTAGAYAVTVTATSGALTQTTVVNVTVN